MNFDLYSVFSIIGLTIVLFLSIIIRLSVREKKEKREAEVAIAMTLVAFLGLLSSTYSNAKNLKDQNSILTQQNNSLRDTLLKQINSHRTITDSLEKMVIKCLTLRDSDRLVKSLSIKVTQGNDGKRIVIENEGKPATDNTFNVNSLTNSKINLHKGDQVFISATGTIRLGAFVGISGPEGIKSGIAGFSLSSYSIAANINHGALIFKYPENGEWTYCGEIYKFTASQDGTLYFNINDNDQKNNSGYYRVNVKIYKQMPPSSTTKIAGFVFDTDGNPLSNVNLSITGINNIIETNEQGSFQTMFEDLPIDNIYSITYSKTGYTAQTLNYSEIPKTNISVYLKKIE